MHLSILQLKNSFYKSNCNAVFIILVFVNLFSTVSITNRVSPKDKNPFLKNYRLENFLAGIIMISAAVLSLIQIISNRSLWLDEAMLAISIVSRNNLELLKPLELSQVAPILYLQIERVFFMIFPDTDYGLRIQPLIAFFISMYFLFKILKQLPISIYGVILGISLFAFNYSFIYYSSEVKQYMTDVLSITAMLYFYFKDYRYEKDKYIALSIAGVIIIFLSNVSPIILFSFGAALLYDYYKNKNISFRYIATVFLIWLITYSIYYISFIKGHPAREIMLFFWTMADGFLPANPLSKEFYVFLFTKGNLILISLISFGSAGEIVLLTLIITGIIYLYKIGKSDILILTITPLLLHLTLSGLKLYPFEGRLILYTIPGIIILCSAGLSIITDIFTSHIKNKKISYPVIIIPVILLISFFSMSSRGFPIKNEEIKNSINFVDQNISEQENIYVYWAANSAFKYYNEVEFVKTKAPVFYGVSSRNNKEKYIEEIKGLKGKYWFIFSHVKFNEENYITEKLGSLGYKKLKEFKTTGSSCYLYDLDVPGN